MCLLSCSSTARREQRYREYHFFGTYAAVQIRTAIALLILAQLGRVDEEAVAGRQEHVAGGACSPRQAQNGLIRKHQPELRTFRSNSFSEFEPQAQTRIPL